jgi:putative NIF3 family GTP cyclohydrolase 1 type 2
MASVTREALVARVKEALGVTSLLVAGPTEGTVTVGAVCAGAGRDLLSDAIRARAEVFLTGELPHHDALRAAREGVTVLCALHSNSERRALTSLRERLSERAPEVSWAVSEVDCDPFTVR